MAFGISTMRLVLLKALLHSASAKYPLPSGFNASKFNDPSSMSYGVRQGVPHNCWDINEYEDMETESGYLGKETFCENNHSAPKMYDYTYALTTEQLETFGSPHPIPYTGFVADLDCSKEFAASLKCMDHVCVRDTTGSELQFPGPVTPSIGAEKCDRSLDNPPWGCPSNTGVNYPWGFDAKSATHLRLNGYQPGYTPFSDLDGYAFKDGYGPLMGYAFFPASEKSGRMHHCLLSPGPTVSNFDGGMILCQTDTDCTGWDFSGDQVYGFHADSLVEKVTSEDPLQSAPVRIGELRVGDSVLGFDDETNMTIPAIIDAMVGPGENCQPLLHAHLFELDIEVNGNIQSLVVTSNQLLEVKFDAKLVPVLGMLPIPAEFLQKSTNGHIVPAMVLGTLLRMAWMDIALPYLNPETKTIHMVAKLSAWRVFSDGSPGYSNHSGKGDGSSFPAIYNSACSLYSPIVRRGLRIVTPAAILPAYSLHSQVVQHNKAQYPTKEAALKTNPADAEYVDWATINEYKGDFAYSYGDFESMLSLQHIGFNGLPRVPPSGARKFTVKFLTANAILNQMATWQKIVSAAEATLPRAAFDQFIAASYAPSLNPATGVTEITTMTQVKNMLKSNPALFSLVESSNSGNMSAFLSATCAGAPACSSALVFSVQSGSLMLNIAKRGFNLGSLDMGIGVSSWMESNNIPYPTFSLADILTPAPTKAQEALTPPTDTDTGAGADTGTDTGTGTGTAPGGPLKPGTPKEAAAANYGGSTTIIIVVIVIVIIGVLFVFVVCWRKKKQNKSVTPEGNSLTLASNPPWSVQDDAALQNSYAASLEDKELGTNERWKQVSKIVGNGHGKKDCHARHTLLKGDMQAQQEAELK